MRPDVKLRREIGDAEAAKYSGYCRVTFRYPMTRKSLIRLLEQIGTPEPIGKQLRLMPGRKSAMLAAVLLTETAISELRRHEVIVEGEFTPTGSICSETVWRG